MTKSSLYAGVGGIDLGFHQSGFNTIWANEYDKNSAKTYTSNFSNKIYVQDIITLDKSVMEYTDVLTAGFPCQSFSIAGYREGFRDPRGQHFFHTMDVVKTVKPKCILLENVKNLTSHNKGETMQIIDEEINKSGYSCQWKVLNSMNFGVPQNRERVYIVCFRKDLNIINFEFPKPIELKTSVHDLLEEKVDIKYYYTKKYNCSQQIIDSIDDKFAVYQWRRKYLRKNKSGVCPTLTANMGTGGHNVPIIYDGTGVRKLTPRECFRIQGFPDSFILPDISDSFLYYQAGNSVTIPVIKMLSNEISKCLCD